MGFVPLLVCRTGDYIDFVRMSRAEVSAGQILFRLYTVRIWLVFAATSCVPFTEVNVAAILFPISAFVRISKRVYVIVF